MSGPAVLVLAIVFFNLALAGVVWQWRTAKQDTDAGLSIPMRSFLPFAAGFVAGGDIALLSLLFERGTPEANAVLGIAVAIFGGGLVLTLTTAFFRWPAWALPPHLCHPERVKHDLGVYHVEAEHAGGSGEYFIAICDCGWQGDPHGSERPARHQAEEHRPNVDPPLRRFSEIAK